MANFRKYFGHALSIVGNQLIVVANRIYDARRQRSPSLVQWSFDQGDKSLRLFYAGLNKESIVFDLGGYEGQWTSDIYAMYRCQVYVFEPVDEFANNISRRFANNQNIHVYQFGLSDRCQRLMLNLDKNASSVYKTGKTQIEIEIVKASDFFEESNIGLVDLMKINIEGAEYDLLEHLLDTGLVNRIKNIQVQFHDFVPGAEQRMELIQKRLKETHELTYQYRFVWENWAIK